jgi:heme/copper-type cytochrome/quinol oxidase subunit 2
LISAIVAAVLLTGLSWLAVSALTRMDSPAAQELRVALQLEHVHEVCGGLVRPTCNFDDREQRAIDREFAAKQRLRLAVLHELETRTRASIDNLSAAENILKTESINLNGDLLGGRQDLVKLLLEPVDLRPLTTQEEDYARVKTLQRAAYSVNLAESLLDPDSGRKHLLVAIDEQRAQLRVHLTRIDALTRRDRGLEIDKGFVDRHTLWAAVFNDDPYGAGGELAGWLLASGNVETVSRSLSGLARYHTEELTTAVFDPAAPVWSSSFTAAPLETFTKSSVRYRSPITETRRWQLFGTLMFALAAFCLVVAGPVVTATHTAREREAGTLPVLRMTGLSADDLALAMVIGPNVFPLLVGGALLSISLGALSLTAGLGALLLPLALLTVLAALTHLTAIGLGDALGHRVNALLVGALLALVLVGAGLLGAVLVISGMSAAGLLFGPLPAVLAGAIGLSGVPGTADLMGASAGVSSLGLTILAYAVATQALLAVICLRSWRRRVEQAWATLFRPAEGVALALACVGCSALTLLDLADRINARSFDNLNLLTFSASAFLLPMLGWLLIASLRRPARATAVASHSETRRAFWRFQALLATTVIVVAFAYSVVMDQTGLSHEPSEIMWATLTQIVLVAETVVAMLLWASRRRTGKHRVFMIGGATLLLQVAFAAVVYQLEVDYVAIAHEAGAPFLAGMNASPYWVTFMIVLWGAGLGMILAALLRERDLVKAHEEAQEEELEDSEEEPRGRWLH